jgi:hypothetical protein
MTEYTVHFQKGYRVGARSLHMVRVEADTINDAIRKGKAAHKAEFGDDARGHGLTRVDHFEDDHIVRDF